MPTVLSHSTGSPRLFYGDHLWPRRRPARPDRSAYNRNVWDGANAYTGTGVSYPGWVGSFSYMLDLRQLHYFVVVVEEGQMTRAAARLHIAQPALSQAIGKLEIEIGVKLLERHSRGVITTEAGATFPP